MVDAGTCPGGGSPGSGTAQGRGHRYCPGRGDVPREGVTGTAGGGTAQGGGCWYCLGTAQGWMPVLLGWGEQPGRGGHWYGPGGARPRSLTAGRCQGERAARGLWQVPGRLLFRLVSRSFRELTLSSSSYGLIGLQREWGAGGGREAGVVWTGGGLGQLAVREKSAQQLGRPGRWGASWFGNQDTHEV